MDFFKKVLNKFNGLHFKQEYLCLTRELLEQPLYAYIIADDNRAIKDITNHHLFIGYSPLVFAFPFYREIDLSKHENIDILFSHRQIDPNDLVHTKDVLALVSLRKIHEQGFENGPFYYYEGINGRHQFISPVQQRVIQLQNKLYNKKPGNVYLDGNLLKQVQIAYSIPRIISLVTVEQNQMFNLFPTDLHGQIDKMHYIISLRNSGKAAQQVETTQKILVTDIRSAFYKTVYSLGKNHMQELKTKEQFPFSNDLSEVFRLPLPQNVISYKELELKRYFDHGIHRFFLFQILNRKQIENQPATLAHVHNVYATWRCNKRLPGNYLLR